MKRRATRKRLFLIVLYNLCFIAVLLIGTELLYRWYITKYVRFEGLPYFEFDSDLGWVPRPGIYDSKTGTVTILSQRFRKANAPDLSSVEKSVLVVGDSFAFCNFVSDEESWPYYLSKLLGVTVINAGVSGYGYDQSILRLKRVIDKVKPDLVILSLIYDDIHRCELSRRVHHKPFFKVIDGKMELFNQPAPLPGSMEEGKKWYDNLSLFRDLWDIVSGNVSAHRHDLQEHDQGIMVAHLLSSMAADLVEKAGARLLIVIQPNRECPYSNETQWANKFERTLDALGITVLNLFPLLESDFPDEQDRIALFGNDTGHHSAKGNMWVAEKVAEYILNSTKNIWKATNRRINYSSDF